MQSRKCQKKDQPEHITAAVSVSEDSRINAWLETIASNHDEEELQGYKTSDDMSPKRALDALSTLAPTDASSKTSKSSIGSKDPNWREFAEDYNIYLQRDQPPNKLIQRAKDIVFNRRDSPELDDAAVLKLANIAADMEPASEDDIVQKLLCKLIPATQEPPDSRIICKTNQIWSNAVHVPTKSSILKPGLPLSKPQPDSTFGFSKLAFTEAQQATANLCIDGSKKSYIKPDVQVRCPFFAIECKAGMKGGTHQMAFNQVANAGAVVLHGHLELARRASSINDFDYNEPKFFSMTLDSLAARINVHWIKAKGDNEFEFHIMNIANYFLIDDEGIRAVQRSVKNILDYALTKQLPRLRSALDAYRLKIKGESPKQASDRAEIAEQSSQSSQTSEEEGMEADERPRKRRAAGSKAKRTSRKRNGTLTHQPTLHSPTPKNEAKTSPTPFLVPLSWKQYLRSFFRL